MLHPVESYFAADKKVIGIDLTGSESKASGWAVMKGCHAITRRINTDEDILIGITLEQPDLISIDSPLSLPIGRISVDDDDPGRTLYGINRKCERQLLKRGIRSYPPLIKSMQKLTFRGMMLAGKIRGLGYPVIEGFPGGAQDVLGLPRKQNGLQTLIQGLKDLGITGSYSEHKVSHDEIDALTAALVGHCYLSGHFESVGDPEEGCIILPAYNKAVNG